ncbi:hypothetical protein Cgig2_014003 [Carnegiea gigantea]|uniref:DUF4283 domain-containing protein n=1 Tax=Carnegiea gigantea TaxID=171969 RepID=A0A9Q1QRR9_9CARY|nr:hypothetical protein Cgig2_014003 [Carnegiea gigantea]
MAMIWRPMKGVHVKDLGENLFLFQFFYELDMRRVLDGGPWCFDQHLLVLKECSEKEQPSKIVLEKALLWMHIYDLPFDSWAETVINMIGSKVGEVMEVDKEDYGTYVRVRLAMEITRPLRRGMKIKDESGGCIWVYFKYERLQICMGHSERECEILMNFPELANEDR